MFFQECELKINEWNQSDGRMKEPCTIITNTFLLASCALILRVPSQVIFIDIANEYLH